MQEPHRTGHLHHAARRMTPGRTRVKPGRCHLHRGAPTPETGSLPPAKGSSPNARGRHAGADRGARFRGPRPRGRRDLRSYAPDVVPGRGRPARFPPAPEENPPWITRWPPSVWCSWPNSATPLAGPLFLALGFWTVLDRADEDEQAELRRRSVLLSMAVAFLVATLGDKIMLATAALASWNGGALATWVGASLGMTAASGLAIVLTVMLGSSLPQTPLAVRCGGRLRAVRQGLAGTLLRFERRVAGMRRR